MCLNRRLTGEKRKNWSSAQQSCIDDSPEPGHLAVAADANEAEFVGDLVYNFHKELENRPVWIGLSRPPQTPEQVQNQIFPDWQWADGVTEYDFSNWQPGEPSVTTLPTRAPVSDAKI